MDKSAIGILETDRTYVELLLSYLRASEYRPRLTLKAYTSFEAVLSSQDELTLLLIGSDMPQIPGSLPYPIKRLTEEKPHEEGELEKIWKYQPLNLFFRQICSWLPLSQNTERSPSPAAACQTIAVYSASGGVGKTTTASNLCRMLAYRSKKVFYLNLETYASRPLFQTHEDRGLSQMLYYIKAGTDQLASKFEQLRCTDATGYIDSLAPCRSPADQEEMTGSETLLLLDLLRTQGYDQVIVDCDTHLSDRIRTVLHSASTVLWLVTDDLFCLEKTRAVCESLGMDVDFAERRVVKTSYLLNKYTGRVVNDPSRFGIRLAGSLPYVPEWKSVASSERVLQEPAFQQHLLHWYNATHGLAEGGGTID